MRSCVVTWEPVTLLGRLVVAVVVFSVFSIALALFLDPMCCKVDRSSCPLQREML